MAEVILEQDMPLIFFYREKSVLPYQGGVSVADVLLEEGNDGLEKVMKAREMLRKRKNQLLLIPFTTIYMYLNGIT